MITDPPYESLEKHRAVGTTTRLKHSKASSNDWFVIFPNERFQELFVEIFRVLRRNSHFYLFCDVETMFVAKPIAESAGFKFWKPLIWDKKKIGMGYHYRARYECILFFEKGKRRLNDLGIPDIIEASRIIKGYPTEKPVPVSEVLIKQSSQSGDLILDPFMGSGSVGMAAIAHGRNFLGNDINEEAVRDASRRLAGAGGVRSPSLRAMLRSEEPMSGSSGVSVVGRPANHQPSNGAAKIPDDARPSDVRASNVSTAQLSLLNSKKDTTQ